MRESQMMLENFIKNLHIGIIVLDADWNMLVWNKPALDLLNIEVEDLLLGTFDTVVKIAPLKEALYNLRSRKVLKSDFVVESESKIVKCIVDRVQYEADEEERIIIIAEDASQQKKLESMKHEFMQIILHRIRNPLSSLKTSLSIVNSGHLGTVPADMKEILDMSAQEVNRLNVLLNDLKNLYVIETGVARKELVLETFPVKNVAERGFEEFLKLCHNKEELKKRLSFTGEIESSIRADFEKLKQVIVILLKNAFDYSSDTAPIEVIVTQDSDIISITVKDQGIGINEESQDYIFSKFYREVNEINNRKEGNGLGLFIARSLLEIMKGTLYYESSKKEGCSFYVNLPKG